MSLRWVNLKTMFIVIALFMLLLDGGMMAGIAPFLTYTPIQLAFSGTLGWLFYVIQFEYDHDVSFWAWVVLIGFLFDLYYTRSIGTYTAAFFLASAAMQRLRQFANPQKMRETLPVYTIGLLVFYSVAYFGMMIAGDNSVSIWMYLLLQALPSILLNVIIGAIFYYPAWSLLMWLDRGGL